MGPTIRSMSSGWVDLRSMICAVVSMALVFGTAVAGDLVMAGARTIVFGIEGNVGRLDPHTSTSWTTFRIILHIFEGLVAEDLTRSDVQSPPIVPALAESWDISEGGKVYTFHLRKGVKFHDGTPWNAEAAKFNMDRMTDTNFEFYQPIAAGLMRWMWQGLDGYEVVDDYIFRIRLKQPNPEFLRRMASGGSGSPRMVSPTHVRMNGNDAVEKDPVGTGPLKFLERIENEEVVLERNPDYWDPKRMPKYDRLVVRGIPEVAMRERALLSGTVDIIVSPSPDSIDYLRDRGMKLVTESVAGAMPPEGFNSGYYSNLKIDELLDEARSAPNEEEMVRRLREVQKIIADDHAFIPYFAPVMIYAMRPNISGLVPAPQHWQDLTQLQKTLGACGRSCHGRLRAIDRLLSSDRG